MKWPIAAAALVVGTPAAAQDLRDYCPDRPGLGTPACTIDKGHVSVETSVADWTLDKQADSRTDTLLIGDTTVRVGVADNVELRVGWTPFGHERTRDRITGAIDSRDRVGDVSLGAKINLLNPDGDKLSIAVLPYATLPVGRSPIGAGDWGAGLVLPVTYELTDALSLEAVPEVDAAVDEDGDGRHLQYSAVGGLSYKLSKAVTLTGEGQVIRDNDPEDHATQALAALSVAWQAKDDLQFDVQGNAGLNHAAPDVELIAGIAKRF
jgi:hypothetical protein